MPPAKLVPITTLVTRKVKIEIDRCARNEKRSLSSFVANLLAEWVITKEREISYGSEKENEKAERIEQGDNG